MPPFVAMHRDSKGIRSHVADAACAVYFSQIRHKLHTQDMLEHMEGYCFLCRQVDA